LRPRSCRVYVDSAYFRSRTLECNVTQGSCLGHCLYLAYAGTLFDVIPPSTTVHGFADDHTCDKQFCPKDPGTERNTKHELEKMFVITQRLVRSEQTKDDHF
jgi:hypothetical protein